ncbi:anti-sigma-F factor Fin family protein [Brevibacillus ruminantium]|uniref:Anti-sigma-F factor Fin family protein n=1 Tax=Brevibacillus ruminantium TaxID=2950604 RepID=A0ABY4WGS4_9BACL|nr:anti-sigma-F factor Fin [Brevibacillus ruminantium]USG65909.1 anti-sigma-F factor Fin family protein [Brevibacillus ruminantium]
MSIRYECRCCGMRIAEFDEDRVSEEQLGLNSLTAEERALIISKELGGDTVVSITCGFCRDALQLNPELSLVNSPLQ